MTKEEAKELKIALSHIDTGNYNVKVMVDLMRRTLCLLIKILIKDLYD